ncbi:protein abrupt isoform X2 [Microplitis demolitor]|uniref:protein abrupt isoform X2 n=1 Tax=Microplitis demolitor TaxID=69319 RepID=UPI00235B67DE|nr:protein abrupt isoform X2 [Microplitis demolitor]
MSIFIMGSSAQLYSLSWGEFSTSLTSAVQLLRGHGDLVDVTLAAGGRSYPAHKIVLSAASPFLLDLLKSTPCEHPVVLLAGVSSDDLESLLEFVYKGEVSVEPSQLPSLLQAAHCLSIHGLASPTILTENGEEVPPTAIPTATEPVTREIMNSCIPINRRKKRRRKSSSSSGKWARIDTANDSEDRHDGHGDDDRTTDYDHKNDETGVHADDGERSKYSNNRTLNDWATSTGAHIPPSLTVTEVQTALTADNFTDIKPSLQTLMAMQQQYSPLHIPTFSGSLSMALPGFPLPTTSSSTLKVRGASDCPGICPLCGATLRQARNLRRHLLSSCKYRLNSFHTLQQSTDHVVVDIEPKIEIGAFSNQNHVNDSGESNSCEQIVCHPSPLPSPTHNSNNMSPHQNISETIAR